MKRLQERESGAVTIEATISLSAFMFTIVTILTIVNICLVQAKIGIAIHGAAKELSHYSYIYSLTGLNGAQSKLAQSAETAERAPNKVLGDINTVFTEIQNLKKSAGEAEDLTGMLEQIKTSYGNSAEAAGSLKSTLEEMAKDPKKVAIGLAKIAATDGWNLAMSRLIAAPLAKQFCKKNLSSSKDGDVEAYLKHLGVKPGANGTYLDGLDFSRSTLFPDGSSEIRINVEYDVKVIALLPLDFTFHFNQCAVTQGWLTGEESYRTYQERIANENIWTRGTIKERADLIRHQGIQDYLANGYEQVCGRSFQDLHVYDPENNEFTTFYSMNPLYSPEGSAPLTLNDISEQAIKEQIEYLCAGVDDTANSLSTVETKYQDANGDWHTTTHECSGASKTIVITIPTDPGLKDKLVAILEECETRGVKVVFNESYGPGSNSSVQPKEEGGE